MNVITEYLEVVWGIIGFVLGCGATITFQKLRQGTNATYSNQSNSRVKGDQAGRDIRKP